MKKAIALSFLLLANMIVLAHAVIPHHHHNKVPVVVYGDYHEHDDTQGHHHHNDNHPADQCTDPDRHCDGVIEDCLLAKIYFRFGNDKQTLQSIDFNFEPIPCLPALFSADPVTGIADQEGLPFRQKPYLPYYHTYYISRSLGLRAPPVC